MDNLTNTLLNDLELLKKIIQEQQLIISQKDSIIQNKEPTICILEERLRCELIKRFTSKSEQHPELGELFNEAEQLLEQSMQQETVLESVVEQPHQVNPSSLKTNPKRRPLPQDLPR